MKTSNSIPVKLLIVVTLFAVSMGFLESAVVIYLRELYYPNGFSFPLAIIPPRIAVTEILREAATVVMLWGIGYLAGKNFPTRFAWFIYSFALWDIFYYVFLKLILNWPASFMTNDILFLLPVTWVGPVITPVIVSISMIVLALLIILKSYRYNYFNINKLDWLLFTTGSLILILGFTWDYSAYILEHYNVKEIFTLPDKNAIFNTAAEYIPRKFNWFLFILGELTICLGIYRYGRRKSI